MNLQNFNSKQLQAILYDQYKFSETPPSVDEFIDSPYYLGVGQPGAIFNMVYPFWRERLREIFPNPFTVKSSLGVLEGSIGD